MFVFPLIRVSSACGGGAWMCGCGAPAFASSATTSLLAKHAKWCKARNEKRTITRAKHKYTNTKTLYK